MKKILEDIRVLDLTHVWFGPFCCMVLGSMGAEVIKIEPPWGAIGRIGRSDALYGGASPQFHYLNRNKKGMAINLKDKEGLHIFKELVKISDVVVQNFSPGTMEKMGIGYEVLKKLNPKIIYAALSGFGQSGPYSPRPSYAFIAEAISGHLRLQGDRIDPKGPPMDIYGAYGDLGPAIWAVMSIIAAIRFRDKTGKGQMIDVAQTDIMVAFNTDIASYILTGLLPWERQQKYALTRGLGGIMKAKDGWVRIAGFRPKAIDNLKKMLGVEELTPELAKEWVASLTRDETVDRLVDLDVAVAPIYQLEETINDPHLAARDMFIEVEHPKAGKIKLPNFPIKFSESPGEIRSAAPLLGQHNREILTKLLGYSDEAVQKLEKDGVLQSEAQ